MPSTTDSATADVDAFLRAIYPADLFAPPDTPRTRPFVTLTYAQSLDGKIAGVGGAQIRLSGAESMAFTHRCALFAVRGLVGQVLIELWVGFERYTTSSWSAWARCCPTTPS